MTSPRDQFFSPLRSDKGWKGCRGNLSQLSRLGQSSGLSSGPLPPGEQPLLQRRLWTPSRGLLSPPSALAAGIFLGSYRGEPGGAPGGKTQNSVGVPWHCGQQKLLTLTRVLTQAQSYVSIIKVLLPAHLPTCSCSRWADPGLTPYILCLSRLWSGCLCAPHFSMLPSKVDFRLFSFSWFYGWKWTFQSSVCQSWNQEFRALKNEDRKAAGTQILTISAAPPSLVKSWVYYGLFLCSWGTASSFFPSRLAGNTSGILLLRMSQHHLYWWMFSLEVGLWWTPLFWALKSLAVLLSSNFMLSDENCEDILHSNTHRGGRVIRMSSQLFQGYSCVWFQQFDSDLCKHDFLWICPIWGSLGCLNVLLFVLTNLWHVSNYFLTTLFLSGILMA